MEGPFNNVIQTLSQHIEVLVLGGAFLCGLMGILCGSIVSICRHTARERSRREIAAYIAEGTMTPEQGERLLAAGAHGKCKD